MDIPICIYTFVQPVHMLFRNICEDERSLLIRHFKVDICTAIKMALV